MATVMNHNIFIQGTYLMYLSRNIYFMREIHLKTVEIHLLTVLKLKVYKK